MRVNTLAAALTGGAVLLAALSGCHATGTSSAATTTAPATTATTAAATTGAGSTTTAATATAAAAGGGGKLDGEPQSCPDPSVVMSNLHLTSLVADNVDASMCRYDYKGNKMAPYVVITFNVVPGFTVAQLRAGLTQGQQNVKPVPGVADAAFSHSGAHTGPGVGLTFLSGSTICSIYTGVANTTPNGVALAKTLLGA